MVSRPSPGPRRSMSLWALLRGFAREGATLTLLILLNLILVNCKATSTTEEFLQESGIDRTDERPSSTSSREDVPTAEEPSFALSESRLRSIGPTDSPIMATVEGTQGSFELKAEDVLPLFMIDSPAAVEAAVMNRIQAYLAECEAERLQIPLDPDACRARVEEILSEQEARLEKAMGRSIPLKDFVRFQYDLDLVTYRAILERRVRESLRLERLVRFEAMQEDRRAYRVIVVQDESLAEELVGKLREGASFAVLAERHSTHVTKDRGGELPLLPVSFRNPLTEGGLRLGVGDVSSPREIRGPNGDVVYRILQLKASNPARPGTWAELEVEILKDIEDNPVDPVTELQAWEQKMMTRYDVNIQPRDSWVPARFLEAPRGDS